MFTDLVSFSSSQAHRKAPFSAYLAVNVRAYEWALDNGTGLPFPDPVIHSLSPPALAFL